jgi:hypothetical protein
MNDISKLHLLVGVKAEQSLRDAVRLVVDQAEGDNEDLELAPVGRKDWVAGVRAGANLSFGELAGLASTVLSRLIALDTHQRIRQENVRVYVVQPPVPVFKDPEPPAPIPDPGPPAPVEPEPVVPTTETPTCPVCNRKVHAYNLQHDTSGKVVGCYICGGNINRAGG